MHSSFIPTGAAVLHKHADFMEIPKLKTSDAGAQVYQVTHSNLLGLIFLVFRRLSGQVAVVAVLISYFLTETQKLLASFTASGGAEPFSALQIHSQLESHFTLNLQ